MVQVAMMMIATTIFLFTRAVHGVHSSGSIALQILIQDSLQDLTHCMIEHNKMYPTRPFVTLAYAQSLDGKIAMFEPTKNYDTVDNKDVLLSSNFAISSEESLVLTHALRSMHDAVLVGGHTLATDNPRLNNRLWQWNRRQPRPVVLDPNLQYVMLLGENMNVHNSKLIVCCTKEAADSSKPTIGSSFTLLPCRMRGDGRLDLKDVLYQLRARHGIQSVMVEGGAAVLTSFVQERLVDYQCVTISPKILGSAGLSSIGSIEAEKYAHNNTMGPFKSITLGPDCVVFCQWKNE
jgi:riboflavin-specific deaminase-like protein